MSSHRAIRLLTPASVLLLVYAIVVNGWVADDAYITFRTIDNFLNGYGLRWNVAERVQAYTHPLWMMVMTGSAAVTREFFFTSLAVSYALSLAAVLVAMRVVSRQAAWKAPLIATALLASKAAIDFTSSGLETPLAYLIAALFAALMLGDAPDERKLAGAALCAALAFLTRPDAVLIFAPAVGALLWRTRRVATVVFASAPAVAWLAFSLVYYGTPLPNTAYAKSLSTKFPPEWVRARGVEYWWNSIVWDTPSQVTLAVALALSLRHRYARLVMAGVAVYVAGIVLSLAATTHMAGRHFAVPFFLSVVVAVWLVPRPRAALVYAAACVLWLAWSPVSPLKVGTRFYRPYAQNPSMIDTRQYAYREGAGLLSWKPGRHLPDHAWYHHGLRMRASPERVFVGVFGGEPIGYAGFAAGPDKFIIDVVALGDPLLSRLPAIVPPTRDEWKSGHFHRDLPAGYVESIVFDGNLIEDPAIHELYAAVRLATRARLWSRSRFAAILRLNLHAY